MQHIKLEWDNPRNKLLHETQVPRGHLFLGIKASSGNSLYFNSYSKIYEHFLKFPSFSCAIVTSVFPFEFSNKFPHSWVNIWVPPFESGSGRHVFFQIISFHGLKLFVCFPQETNITRISWTWTAPRSLTTWQLRVSSPLVLGNQKFQSGPADPQLVLIFSCIRGAKGFTKDRGFISAKLQRKCAWSNGWIELAFVSWRYLSLLSPPLCPTFSLAGRVDEVGEKKLICTLQWMTPRANSNRLLCKDPHTLSHLNFLFLFTSDSNQSPHAEAPRESLISTAATQCSREQDDSRILGTKACGRCIRLVRYNSLRRASLSLVDSL